MYATTTVEDIPYRVIGGETLLLDIVRPQPLPADPMPVVIYIFGSGWMENKRKDREQNPGTYLTAHTGICTVSIDYRLSSQALFPAQIADARAAVRWVRAHAGEYHFDPERIGTWGYSSGGHLAALLGTASAHSDFDAGSEPSPYSCAVQAVVTLGVPTNFLIMGGAHNNPDSAEALLIGGPVQERVEQVRQASPLTYVSEMAPPFLLMHGEQDDIVLIEQSRLLYEALIKAGVEATFLPLAGAGHYAGPTTPYWDSINTAAGDFFSRHLGRTGN